MNRGAARDAGPIKDEIPTRVIYDSLALKGLNFKEQGNKFAISTKKNWCNRMEFCFRFRLPLEGIIFK